MRLFLAIELPEEILDRLAGAQAKIPGARWVLDHQHHLTLLFLGEVSPEQLDKIYKIVSSVSVSEFSIHLRGLDFFGREKSPKVIYLGVEQNEELLKLQNQIRSQIQRRGFTIENRKFTPHVTMARLRNPNTKVLAEYLENNAGVDFEPFPVRHVTLFESVLKQDGARYLARERFLL